MKPNIRLMYVLNWLKNLLFFGAVTVPFFLDWARIDYTRIFLLEASFSFWIFVLEIPTGIIADRYGRKYSLALGALIAAFSFFIFGLSQNYWSYIGAELICAIGFTLLSGADKALLYDTLAALKQETKAARCFSRYESAGLLGMITGLAGGSWVAGSKILPYPATLPLTFTSTGVVFLLAAVVALTLQEPQRNKPNEAFLQSGINGFKTLFQNHQLRGLVFNSTLIAATTFFMYWLYQSWLRSLSIPLASYGTVGAAFNLFGIWLMLSLNPIAKRCGTNRVLFLSALLPGLLYLGLAFTRNPVYGLVAIFGITGLRQLRVPLFSDFINRQIDSENRATVLSGISMLERIVIMILYPLIGLLSDTSLSIAFLFLGIITIGFAVCTRIKSESEPEATSDTPSVPH